MPTTHTKLSLKELNRLSINEYQNEKKIPLIVVLDNIRSMSNIGSVFRTSDAFCVEAIHLCGITSRPPQREIQKTALGATESVKWKYFKNTMDSIKELKQNGYQIISIEQVKNSTMLTDYKAEKAKKIALVLGNEVKGVEQEVIDKSDLCIEIPQYGTKHSLNVSISGGLVIWHIFQQIFEE
ncbi:MAG: RNA methyltransferase [Bacteroidetes bacterium 4572_77]|nr:MAG: RNA methyltransferase [Bacteroidetes bacterium 4572_77]